MESGEETMTDLRLEATDAADVLYQRKNQFGRINVAELVDPIPQSPIPAQSRAW